MSSIKSTSASHPRQAFSPRASPKVPSATLNTSRTHPHPPQHTMICRTCQRASHFLPTRRLLYTTRPSLNATHISSASQPTPNAPPAATSSSAAQPFSAPLTPSPTPSIEKAAAKAVEKKATPLVKSSVPAGTPLKGLNFEKAKSDPVALADDEYPAWLWTILKRQEGESEVGGLGDLFCTCSIVIPTQQFPPDNSPMALKKRANADYLC